ncbi:MAG: hypothetical protein NZ789_01780, partial [Pseudomonadales bacterium]|nr:hypothetical protein [Pseudomonadales bacterium]
AISFLQNAIENEPQRTDIQLRLLEVYVQTEDATAFNLQYEQLKLLGDDGATREGAELQAEIPGAAETSAAAMDATMVSSEAIAAIEDIGIDDDDLSFDLDDVDDLNAETDDDDLDLTADTGEELSLEEAMELGDADLDLDLDAGLEEVNAESEEEDLDLALGLDDEIDLDFGDDVGDGEDDGLDLDLDDASDDDALDLDLGDDDSLELVDDDSLELVDNDDELNLDEDASSKLDLARAYIEMGDNDGAKPLLQEVLVEGDDVQVSEANELLGNISGKA